MKQHGISLLEAVISLLLIAITLATIIPVFANYAQQNSRNELRTSAVLVAQEQMDEIRSISPDNYNSELGPSPVTINVNENGIPYQLIITYANCSSVAGLNCTTSGAKWVNLQVLNNSELFYEVENVYTRLE